MIRKNYINYIFISILICIALPSIILFGIIQLDYDAYATYHVSQVASKHLEYKVKDALRWTDDKMDLVQQYATAAEAYAQSYGFDETMEVFLENLVASDADVESIVIKTEAGQWFTGGKESDLIKLEDMSWYKGAVFNDVYISKAQYFPSTETVVITCSKSIRDEKGMLQGVLGIHIPVEHFLNKIIDANGTDQFEAVFVSNDGVRVSTNENLDTYLDAEAYDEWSDAGNTVRDLEIDGQAYSGIKLDIDAMQGDLFILLRFEKNNAFKNIILKTFMERRLLFIALVMAAILIFNEYLYRPLHRLSAYIRKTANEGKSVKRPKLPKDLGKIEKMYSKLLDVAAQRESEVLQMTSHVSERNAQIETSNEELEASFKELKELNDLLEEKEREYNDFVSNIPDLLWLCSSDGTLVYANEHFQRTTGLVLSDKHKIHLSDFLDGLPKGTKGFKLFSNRDFGQIVLDIKCKGGDVRNMEGSVSRIFEGDEIVAIQGILRDTSDSKAMYVNYFNRNRELTLVNDITKSLISNLDLEIILNEIADKVGRIMRIGMCTIRLIENGKLKLVASSGSKKQMIYARAPYIEETHMGEACRANKTKVISNRDEFTIDEQELEKVLDMIHSVVYVPLSINDKVYGVMSVASELEVDEESTGILETFADQAAIAIERSKIYENLRSNYFKTIEALVAANDAKAPNREGHTKRVSDIAVEVGKRMYMRQSDIDNIYIAGLLHDIGKLNIEDALLSKDNLTDEEKAIIEAHPMMAKKILEPIGMSEEITQGIYYHHKKFDLSGEPKEVKIDTLPLIARIIGAVDDLDAYLVEHKSAGEQALKGAIDLLKFGSGKAYCPEVVKILEEISNQDASVILMHYEQLVDEGKEVAI